MLFFTSRLSRLQQQGLLDIYTDSIGLTPQCECTIYPYPKQERNSDSQVEKRTINSHAIHMYTALPRRTSVDITEILGVKLVYTPVAPGGHHQSQNCRQYTMLANGHQMHARISEIHWNHRVFAVLNVFSGKMIKMSTSNCVLSSLLDVTSWFRMHNIREWHRP